MFFSLLFEQINWIHRAPQMSVLLVSVRTSLTARIDGDAYQS
jgi:hypothetical protein